MEENFICFSHLPNIYLLRLKIRYYCLLRSYKKGCFFLLFYVFFDVESESEVRFGL